MHCGPGKQSRARCCDAVHHWEVEILKHGASHAVNHLGMIHYGILGPVRTGNGVNCELFTTLHLQRRMLPRSSISGPARFVPPPCGTTAPPCPCLPFLEDQLPVLLVLQASPCPGAAAGHCLWPSLRQEELPLRFGNDYMYSGTGATTTSSRYPFPGSSEVVRDHF